MQPRRIVVVANQTAVGSALRTEIRRRIEEGPCKFVLVVPATPPQEHATWTEGRAHEIAQHRLDAALETFEGMGADITGVVGDASPSEAIGDVLLEGPCDEIILSTLPSGISRWLKQDLPHRLERRFGVPVSTLVATSYSAPVG